MLSLEEEIKAYLSTFTFEIGEVEIRSPFQYNKPNIDKPVIVIQEILNAPRLQNYTDDETYSNLGYQISVISRNVKITKAGETEEDTPETMVLTPYEAVNKLSMEVCDCLKDRFLLIRQGEFLSRAYTEDNTVMEKVFRLNTTVDLNNKYLYRG